MSARLDGVFVPAATPFGPGGDLDAAALEAAMRWWDASGPVGVMVLGSNGESRALSDGESLDVVRAAVGGKGALSLVVGVGRESLRLTVELADRVAGVGGVDAVAVLTPHYFADLMSEAALVAFYREVADRSPLPVLLYVAPRFANGVVLPPSAVAELADHPNVRGIKDSDAGRLTAHLAPGPRPDFAVLAGSLGSLLACLDAGGAGGVVSAANYLPRECARIAALHAGGDRDAAVAELARISGVVEAVGRYGVAGVKACLGLRGRAVGDPRLPVPPVPDDGLRAIRAALDEARVG